MNPPLKSSPACWTLGLCSIALLAAATQATAAAQPAGTPATTEPATEASSPYRLDKRFTVDGRAMVTVRNAQGTIVVKSWQRSEVEILADHGSEGVEVDATQNGNRIEVITHVLRQDVSAAELQANYEIYVPEETELEIKNDSGLVSVTQVYADISVDTVLSKVELSDVSGVLTVHTVDGSFTCTRCVGRIEFTSTSGGARFLQPTTRALHAQTFSGDLFFDGKFSPNGNYRLSTASGPIEVVLSEKDSVKLTAHSRQGNVENQVKLKPESHMLSFLGGRKENSLVGTTGTGLARLELTSFSGKILIRKRD
ncbi:MAG TPA: DUF4097 family beta strand repeat-containing protein [Candidatus Acidoferrales bacterium]|nr:DUF4097 family beta strand repeat-containing protein [Candidatus Acidoferrales bacterium]